MSLYNALFGVNRAAPLLLAMLGISAEDVPRFRDCYIAEGKIAIYTRTGGGNRDTYEHPDRAREWYHDHWVPLDICKAEEVEKLLTGPWNCDLRKLPGFQYDEDDDYDSTYATFYFDIPEKFKHLLDKIPEGENPAQRWRDTLDKLQNASPDDPQVKKVMEVMAPVFAKIKDWAEAKP